MDDLKTKIAEAIYASAGRSPPEPPWEEADQDIRDWISEHAQAALQAIHDAGYAVVPRQATGPMVEIGSVRPHEWDALVTVQDSYNLARRKWSAMLQASQPNTKEPG